MCLWKTSKAVRGYRKKYTVPKRQKKTPWICSYVLYVRDKLSSVRHDERGVCMCVRVLPNHLCMHVLDALSTVSTRFGKKQNTVHQRGSHASIITYSPVGIFSTSRNFLFSFFLSNKRQARSEHKVLLPACVVFYGEHGSHTHTYLYS